MEEVPMLLKPKEAARLLGLSRSGLYRRLDDPGFPRPVRLGPRTVRWRRTELVAFTEKLS
jgi:prophage regulatory protein